MRLGAKLSLLQDWNDAVHTFGQTVERKKAKESAKDKDPKEAGVDEKIAELNKCKIQIGERSEAECAPPEVQLDFDSWKHEVGMIDITPERHASDWVRMCSTN
eukprot:g25635.t1